MKEGFSGVQDLPSPFNAANSIVNFQTKNAGQYRTWLYIDGKRSDRNWDNAATEAATAILALNDALNNKKGKQ